MNKTFTITLLFISIFTSTAQDKIWLDENQQPTTNSEKAVFYKSIEKDESAHLIKEETFYKENDQLFSKGYREERTSYPTGTWQWFYMNGNKMRLTTYSSGRMVGYQSIYDVDGKLIEQYAFHKSRKNEMPYNYKYKKEKDGYVSIENGNGSYDGPYLGEDKSIDSLSGNYKNNKATGIWKAYKDNILITEDIYMEGKVKNGKRYDTNGKVILYNSVFQRAEPIIGSKKFVRKLYYNIHYYYEQIKLKKNDYRTTFNILFDVNVDGTIENIRIMNGMGKGPDEMAIKALREVKSKWKPALKKGIPVKTTVSIPYSMESRECMDC